MYVTFAFPFCSILHGLASLFVHLISILDLHIIIYIFDLLNRHKNGTEQKALPYHKHTLPLIAHNRPNLQSRIPINQVKLNQQQILAIEQHQNGNTGVVGSELSRIKDRNVDSDQMYCNTMQSQTDSMYSDSVKYYVLENLQEPKAS